MNPVPEDDLIAYVTGTAPAPVAEAIAAQAREDPELAAQITVLGAALGEGERFPAAGRSRPRRPAGLSRLARLLLPVAAGFLLALAFPRPWQPFAPKAPNGAAISEEERRLLARQVDQLQKMIADLRRERADFRGSPPPSWDRYQPVSWGGRTQSGLDFRGDVTSTESPNRWLWDAP